MSLFPLAFRPPVIAHRGARAKAPENTLAAFRQAHADGAKWFEVDVKLTHDGAPILMHDDTVDGTTNEKGAVADIMWAVMQKFDAGSWFGPSFAGEHIPHLAEALRFALEKGMQINLEIKPCPGRTQATTMVTLIEAAKIWPLDHPPPLISSFDIEALVIASRLHPEWPRGLLLEEWRDDWEEIVKKTRATAIHLDETVLTQKHVEMLTDARLPVLAYTVNDPARAKELLRWGVKAVFSDDPGKIISAL